MLTVFGDTTGVLRAGGTTHCQMECCMRLALVKHSVDWISVPMSSWQTNNISSDRLLVGCGESSRLFSVSNRDNGSDGV